MSNKRDEQIWVLLLTRGYIPRVGLSGPFPYPIKLSRGLVYDALVDGVAINSYDIETGMNEPLTIHNVFADKAKKVKDTVKEIEEEVSVIGEESKDAEVTEQAATVNAQEDTAVDSLEADSTVHADESNEEEHTEVEEEAAEEGADTSKKTRKGKKKSQ